jgi:hypothetical protein
MNRRSTAGDGKRERLNRNTVAHFALSIKRVKRALVRSADDQEKSTFLGVLCIWYRVRGVGRGV